MDLRCRGELSIVQAFQIQPAKFFSQDPESGRITDFFCFYSLPSTAIKITPNQTIDAAYLFYYATSECPTCSALLPNGSASQGSSTVPTWDKENEKERAALKKRLNLLMADMLVMANRVGASLSRKMRLSADETYIQAKFDVVNALTLMDNNLFLADQKFGAGDGCTCNHIRRKARRLLSQKV